MNESCTNLLTAMAVGRETSIWVRPKSLCRRCQSKETLQLDQLLKEDIVFSVGFASPFTLLDLTFIFFFFFLIYLFIYSFIYLFGCVGSLFLCEGFL